MRIDKLILGTYETNSYILRGSGSDRDVVIIDTGLTPQPLINFLKQNELNPIALILTHGHADHIAGITPLRQSFSDIKIVIHTADTPMLSSGLKNLSALAGVSIKTEPADLIIENEGPIAFAGITLNVLHTPGHTPGGICLYSQADSLVFSGDTLFAGSVGRTDFPNYNVEECFARLVSNIKTKLVPLPDETRVLPGHGPETTMKNEKKHNPYLQQ